MNSRQPTARWCALAIIVPVALLGWASRIAQAQTPDRNWSKTEGEDFVLPAPARVRYGAGERWVEKTVKGSGSCSNAFFGSDPAPQVRKRCTLGTPIATAAAAPRPSAKGIADVVDRAGAIVPQAYRAIAANMGEAEGIAYRYGPEPAADAAARAKLPTLYEREDQFARCDDKRHCRSSWQVGGPRREVDFSYSTNQSSVVFVADDPAERAGVGDLQASAFETNTYAQKPQLPWQLGGGGLDSINVLKYRSTGLLPDDGSARPVAAGRCSGPAGYCPTSVIAFQNGLLATTGSNTAHNQATARLAPNKVPTAVAMTGNSEFAFVTVWDTAELKGQVAVVALAGLCDGCKLEGPYYEWWSEWQGVYPGLPNMGNIAFMKVLGYVDLPGMQAPTEIAVTTGLHPFNTVLGGGLFMGQAHSPLARHWRSFTRSGENYQRYAKGGVAVVVSKSERKAAFIDLKPLFDYINGVYFSEAVADIGPVGQDERQWPHGFGFRPQARPVVAKTVTLDARPTAVKTTLTRTKDARAWIATQEGALRIYDLGGYAPGAEARTGSPNGIQALGKVAVGRNPTSLAHSKGEPDPAMRDDPLNGQVIVTARDERKIQWVRFSPDGRGGRVVRTLQDSRIVDPVAAEDIDNFANVGLTLGVADYGGRAVLNYRYGTVVFADRGAQWACQPPRGCPVKPTGDVAIEFGGGFAMQGRPFQINTSNVP